MMICHNLFDLLLGTIGRLCYLIVAIPGHLLYHLLYFASKEKMTNGGLASNNKTHSCTYTTYYSQFTC